MLQKNNVRLNAIGNIGSLPEKANKKLISVINATSGNDELALTLALSYGSQDEMVKAIRKVALEVAEGKLDRKHHRRACGETLVYGRDAARIFLCALRG